MSHHHDGTHIANPNNLNQNKNTHDIDTSNNINKNNLNDKKEFIENRNIRQMHGNTNEMANGKDNIDTSSSSNRYILDIQKLNGDTFPFFDICAKLISKMSIFGIK